MTDGGVISAMCGRCWTDSWNRITLRDALLQSGFHTRHLETFLTADFLEVIVDEVFYLAVDERREVSKPDRIACHLFQSCLLAFMQCLVPG